jgi:hypothetical protein
LAAATISARLAKPKVSRIESTKLAGVLGKPKAATPPTKACDASTSMLIGIHSKLQTKGVVNQCRQIRFMPAAYQRMDTLFDIPFLHELIA